MIMILDAIDIVKTNHIKEHGQEGNQGGRKELYHFRKIKLVKGLLGNAEGSAQVDLGGTKVLAGVKLDLAEPMEDTPDRGNFMVSVRAAATRIRDVRDRPAKPGVDRARKGGRQGHKGTATA